MVEEKVSFADVFIMLRKLHIEVVIRRRSKRDLARRLTGLQISAGLPVLGDEMHVVTGDADALEVLKRSEPDDGSFY
jgi:hypothetical protein